jgi:hypothetical protein
VEYEIKSRTAIESASHFNGGIMFDIEAKQRVVFHELEFGTSSQTSLPCAVYSTRAKISAQKAKLDESGWVSEVAIV